MFLCSCSPRFARTSGARARAWRRLELSCWLVSALSSVPLVSKGRKCKGEEVFASNAVPRASVIRSSAWQIEHFCDRSECVIYESLFRAEAIYSTWRMCRTGWANGKVTRNCINEKWLQCDSDGKQIDRARENEAATNETKFRTKSSEIFFDVKNTERKEL